MIDDGLKSIGKEMEVMDIAELLWEQIKAKDEEIQATITAEEE
jgi:hypothetical protein